jgi:hypothetical protein
MSRHRDHLHLVAALLMDTHMVVVGMAAQVIITLNPSTLIP